MYSKSESYSATPEIHSNITAEVYEQGCEAALQEVSPRIPNLKNRIEAPVEEAVLANGNR
jgi:hypothetical protein